MRPLPPLRSRLLWLAAGSVLPLLVLAAALGAFLVGHEQDLLQQAAQDRNRTLLSAVEAEAQGHILALRVIAASPALQAGDLRAFHAELRRALATQPDWRNLLLVDAAGQQIANARIDAGQPLPREDATDAAALPALVASGRPGLGDLGRGPVTGLPGIPVRLPVARSGGGAYVLEAIVKPESLARLMARQDYPAEWAVALLDRTGRFVVRQPYRAPGDSPSPALARALSQGPQVWFRGRTLEGQDTYTALRRSELTGWSVAVAIPASTVNGAAYRMALLLAAAGAASLALASLFAFWLARRIAGPIAELADAARQLDGDPVARLAQVRADPGVLEVMKLADALDEGSAALRERELLLEREQRALRAADHAKDEFIAMLGHELRNPLSAITASAHVLRLSKPGAETAVNAHAVIDRQARQMTRLVEDLLDVSRLAMNKVTLRPERLDLGDLVARVVKTWQGSGRSRVQRILECRLQPTWVEADRARMEQVLGNLLDNAEKFSPAGTPIRLHLGADGSHAVLEVEDEGEGIAPEELPRVFDLFVQGPQTLDRPKGGLGLGLALVKRLVELHGGSVTVASAGPGQGSCFTLRLPLAGGPPMGELRAAGSARPAQARKVLLVEDNEDGRAAMADMLALEGHEVRSAATGEAGVHLAQEFQPDVALVDIGLPDIDGFEVARRVRAGFGGAPPKLVAVSGFGQPDDLRRAYESGFDLHLTKPVTPEFLREVIGALTSRQAVKS